MIAKQIKRIAISLLFLTSFAVNSVEYDDEIWDLIETKNLIENWNNTGSKYTRYELDYRHVLYRVEGRGTIVYILLQKKISLESGKPYYVMGFGNFEILENNQYKTLDYRSKTLKNHLQSLLKKLPDNFNSHNGVIAASDMCLSRFQTSHPRRGFGRLGKLFFKAVDVLEGNIVMVSQDQKLRFVMSYYGEMQESGLASYLEGEFENWLYFDQPSKHHLYARWLLAENIKSSNMPKGINKSSVKACNDKAKKMVSSDVEFVLLHSHRLKNITAALALSQWCQQALPEKKSVFESHYNELIRTQPKSLQNIVPKLMSDGQGPMSTAVNYFTTVFAEIFKNADFTKYCRDSMTGEYVKNSIIPIEGLDAAKVRRLSELL